MRRWRWTESYQTPDCRDSIPLIISVPDDLRKMIQVKIDRVGHQFSDFLLIFLTWLVGSDQEKEMSPPSSAVICCPLVWSLDSLLRPDDLVKSGRDWEKLRIKISITFFVTFLGTKDSGYNFLPLKQLYKSANMI